MVFLFLKETWFVLSLNRHAQMAVARQEPAQQTGTGRGLLSLAVPAAKWETTARGSASSFKDHRVSSCHPGWKQILCICGRVPSFLLKKLYLLFL